MRHFDQTLLFDSFMNIRQEQSSDVNNLNIYNNNNNGGSSNNNNYHNNHTINNINIATNNKNINNNNLSNVDIIPIKNSKMDNRSQEDMDIFQLYKKAKQNLSHSNRILNLSWRLYKVRSKQSGVSGGNNQSLIDRYKVEDSFIFQGSSVFNQYDTNSEYLLLNHQKFDNINYNNGYSDSHNNRNTNNKNINNNINNINNSLFNNIHSINDTNSNFFIDNDNFTTRDNEFDMFIEDPPSSIHESLVTPLPMDIPQSLPNHMFHYSNSFDQDHTSSSFIFQRMTPSSLTTTPITSFAPTPSVPLTSTTTTLAFNDSMSSRNEESISISLPKANDLLKQRRSGGAANTATKRRVATRTNNNNNNTNSNGNSSSVPTKCSNCGTYNTPLWRKDPQGNSLCNACGLFLKLHGVMRPLSLKTDTIKKRQRNTNSNNTNNTKKNYNVKKVVSKDKSNFDWLSLNL